jgi:hypothetical protein
MVERMNILEFLNLNSGAVTAISTVVLTIVTFVYVLLTRSISKETEIMRKTQTEPNISAIIQPDERYINWINLIIQNIGLGPAYNVKFELNPDFEDSDRHPNLDDESINYKLSDVGFIKNGLPYFAPNQKFQFYLTNLADNYQKKLKKTFEIKVTYESNIHEPYSNTYLIDFSQQNGLSQLGEPPIYTIAKNIEQIQKDINHISTGFTKLKIIRYTKEDIDEENNQFLEQFKQQEAERDNTKQAENE